MQGKSSKTKQHFKDKLFQFQNVGFQKERIAGIEVLREINKTERI